MKVLFIHNAFFPHAVGGAEHSLLDRIQGLKLLGVDADVLTINALSSKDVDYVYQGVRVKALGLPWFASSPANSGRGFIRKLIWHFAPYLGFFFGYWRVKKFVHDNGYGAVFIINTPGVPYSICLSTFGLRKIAIVADYNYLCVNGKMYSAGKNCAGQCVHCKCYSALKKPILGACSDVVFISNYLRQVHSRDMGVDGCVIYNGEKECGINSYRSRVSQKFCVGFIGQINPNKGLDKLLVVLNGLVQEGVDISLVVAGEGHEDYLAYLKSLAPSLSVDWLGRVEKDDFYKLVDLVVVPSVWNEPLGRVPFEAAMRHVPVIVSTTGGLPETVHSALNTFDVASDSDLRGCVHRFYKMDQVERKGEVMRAYTFAKSKFSGTCSATKYFKLIEND